MLQSKHDFFYDYSKPMECLLPLAILLFYCVLGQFGRRVWMKMQ